MQDNSGSEMSKIFLFTLLILWQSDMIQQTSLIWARHCIDFHLKLWRFSRKHVLNLPCFLIDFLTLDYYVQSHMNIFLWHLSCTKSYVCVFKQALMRCQVVQFIQYFQMGKNKFTKQARIIPRPVFISKEEVQKHHQQSFPLSYTWENIWICLK